MNVIGDLNAKVGTLGTLLSYVDKWWRRDDLGGLKKNHGRSLRDQGTRENGKVS